MTSRRNLFGPRKTGTASISVSAAMYARIKAAAESRGVTMAAIVEAACADLLRRAP